LIRSKERRRQLLLMCFGLLITVIMLFPIYWMFVTSIKPLDEIYRVPPLFFPEKPTLAPYIQNFTSKNSSILKYMKNSFIIASGTMIISLILATPAAYALARKRLKGITIFLLLLLVGNMFPSIILATPLYILFVNIGITDTYLGLILGNLTLALPFVILMLRPFFLSLPKDLEDASLIDGCNKFTSFVRIILPLIRPGLITIATFSFLGAWGEFLFAVTLSNNADMRPVTVGMYNYISEYQAQWNNLMAAAFLSALPIVLAFVFLQKYIVAGMTAGSSKG
jgi:multiple sugar transport system permease protein